MTNQFKNGTTVIRLVCSILFLLFSFLYLYEYQADILSFTQHVLSKGVTHYNRMVGAIVITLVLWLLQIAIHTTTRINGFFHALTYFPPFILLGVLTDVTPNLESEGYIGHWFWLFPLLMIIYAGVVWMCKQMESVHHQVQNRSVLFSLWVNLLGMIAMSLLTCFIGCNDRLFHHRMHIERLLSSGQYADASKVGILEEETDSSLTFLRIWALSKQNKLGESLFEYPLVGGSDAMLPNGTSVQLVMPSESVLYKDLGVVFRKKLRPMDYLKALHQTKKATRISHDWLLCAYLLDCDIDGFTRSLPLYYQLNTDLPKHYQEALTLYTHLRNNPMVVFKDPVMEADYEGFQAIRRKNKDKRVCYTILKDSYGKTYWLYYYKKMNKL